MVTLAVLPGMLRTSLVVADLANPGNSSRAINLLVSQPGIVGLEKELLDSTLHSSSFDSELTLNEGQLTGTVKKLHSYREVKPKPNDGPPSLGVISG